MKSLLVTALIALAFTTGFTCSKNTPTEQPAQEAAPAQEQMAVPPEGQTPPATEAPVEAPAAPAEPPPAETK